MIAVKKGDFKSISEKFHISPITARLLVNRDVKSLEDIEKYLSSDINAFHNPLLLPDIEVGVSTIAEKIKQQKKIRIIGDYDVDGVCATFILYQSIKILGGIVDYVIPHRIEDGYGLNANLIEKAYQDNIDTILTCDNGIAAAEPVKLAVSYGMTVVITDHHEVPYTLDGEERKYVLPNAIAIIDPKREDCQYPYKDICGAFVAYKFVSLLLEKLLYPEQKMFLRTLVSFAAMATICDVMELKDENRVLVKYGLQLMTDADCNIGLSALISAAGISGGKITPYHIGFVIGPCINATGRLDTALRALELFQEEDKNNAALIAEELRALNESRKQLTKEGVEASEKIVEEQYLADKVLVVYLEDCHESLAGIIAGRLKEKYQKPCLVFTKTDKCIKGSGRSIEKYQMYDELNKCSDLFVSFGGHAMAAGVSVANLDNLNTLRQRLNKDCILTEDDFKETVHIDMELPLDYVSKELVNEFELLEPYGNGNKKPLFVCRDVKILSCKVLGKNRNVCRYKVMDQNNKLYEMIRFSPPEEMEEYLISKFPKEAVKDIYTGDSIPNLFLTVTYQTEINYYNGNSSVQYIIQDYR